MSFIRIPSRYVGAIKKYIKITSDENNMKGTKNKER